MSTIISDPQSCSAARVTTQGKLETYSITTDEKIYATEQGEAFIVSSPIFELTNDAETALLYIKNNGEENSILIDEITFITTASNVGADVDYTISLLKNPTAGTLLASSNTLDVINLNAGSGKELLIETKSGGTGSTVADPILPVFKRLVTHSGETRQFTTPISIPRGSSVAILINPPIGNTSMKIQINTDIHIKNLRSNL